MTALRDFVHAALPIDDPASAKAELAAGLRVFFCRGSGAMPIALLTLPEFWAALESGRLSGLLPLTTTLERFRDEGQCATIVTLRRREPVLDSSVRAAIAHDVPICVCRETIEYWRASSAWRWPRQSASHLHP